MEGVGCAVDVNGMKVILVENLRLSFDGLIGFLEGRGKANQQHEATWEEMQPHSKAILREFFFKHESGCASLRLPKSDDGVARLIKSGVILERWPASTPDYAEFVIEKGFRDFLKKRLYGLGRNDYPSEIPQSHPAWVTTRVNKDDNPFRWAANFLKFVEFVQLPVSQLGRRPQFCSSQEFVSENGDYLEHMKGVAIQIMGGRTSW